MSILSCKETKAFTEIETKKKYLKTRIKLLRFAIVKLARANPFIKNKNCKTCFSLHEKTHAKK